jgi:predicted small metal-binding protein
MKNITCSQLGGPCDHTITAESKDELMAKGMEHIKQAHPEMVADIENMSDEEMTKWKAEHLDKVWDETPEASDDHSTENVLIMDEEK